MADAPLNALSWFGLDKPTLPYRTNTSPVDESPHWVSGSSNTMGTIKGAVEKRPGFSTAVESALSSIPGIVTRLYTWRRFSGSFFIMASVTTTSLATPSQVWKLEVGVDPSFVLIYSDTSSSSPSPFDFVTSNNFCFFGNQTIRSNMRKFDGSKVSLWGLDFPVTAPALTLITGTLPPGLSFASGSLSGTPAIPGNYSVTFNATDPSGTTYSQSLDFAISASTLDWQTASGPLPPVKKGTAVSSNAIQAWGGVTPYIYSVVSGSLPAGLSLNATTGVLSGTPTATGDFAFAVQVTDSAGTVITREFSQFVGDPTISITPPSPNTATIGTAYSGSTVVSGGTAPYSYSLVTGSLPPGLSANASGVLSGTPSTSGVYPVTFQVTDANGISNQATNTYTISSVVLNIADQAPPAGKVGYSYTFTPLVTGGNNAAVTTPITTYHYSGGIVTINTATPTGVVVGSMIQSMIGPHGTLGSNIVSSIISPTSFVTTTGAPGTYSGSGGEVIFSPPATSYTITATAEAITAQTGYIYGQTFTSIYGHESSMSALSASTGVFTNLDPRVNVLSSSDPQVNGINLYRTTDGGDADPAAMRLVASLPNVDASYIDSTLDIYLGLQTGPALYVNDPPQPLDGFVWSNGRIWGRNGAKTWFTGNEEVTNGIPEECMSDAINGNFYAWPSEVGGMAVTSNGVDIGLDEQFWQVSGDALSTFRKSKLLAGGGTRYPINIIDVGDSVMWIDTAKQVFSSSDGEFGEAIRPDFQTLDLSQSFIVFHKSKLYNWIVILDAFNSIVYVYDLDLNQWHTPWILASPASAITSGETSVGGIQLIIAFTSGHVMQLTPGSYLDDALPYGENLKSNLLAIVPGRGTSGRNTAEVRTVVQFDMEVSKLAVTPATPQSSGMTISFAGVTTPVPSYPLATFYTPRTPDYFACLVDDDPAQSTQDNFFDLSPNLQPPQYQDQTIQKRYISPNRWTVDQAVPRARRVSFYAQWNPLDEPWSMYSCDVAWRT